MFFYLDDDIIGYKKLRDVNDVTYIATLLIPKRTLFYTLLNPKDMNQKNAQLVWWRGSIYKCRAEEAEVLEIIKAYDGEVVDFVEHCSEFDEPTLYITDEMVYPNSFSLRHEQCAGGIHFFPDRVMAERW